MKYSLRVKVSLTLALIIAAISALSTYMSISAHTEHVEGELIARGKALNFSLSKAATVALAEENLSLLTKSYDVVKAEDMVLSQVFSTIWEPVDAFPIARLKDQPNSLAVEHFKNSEAQVYFRVGDAFDFYSPIVFNSSQGESAITIGFVRTTLSAKSVRKEINDTIRDNIVISFFITLAAIIGINIIIGRLVLRPVMELHRSVLAFKGGVLPTPEISGAAEELKELASEFTHMCHMVQDNEARLRDSEQRIKSLFERVEHAIFRLDADGTLRDSNKRFRDMYGNVHSFCEIFGSDKAGGECLNSSIQDRLMHVEEQTKGVGGEVLTVSLSLYAETDASGALRGFDGYLIDITDKRRLEDRLLRSQKLEAVGTLAGGIAHDFNNLLAAIMGYSEILLDATVEGDAFHKPASIIHAAAERGAELTQKILSVTRKEKLAAKPVDVNEIVTSVIDLVARSFPKDIVIGTSLDQCIPLTGADPSQIHQVILNLAVNARDAMPHGGKLTIETTTTGVSGQESYIKLSISDTGVGMSKELQGKIFDPFFTTKETGKGTGLGLYIVHSIVHNHGGYINIYSEPGKGTRFNVYVPVTKGIDVELVQEPADMRGTGTILVIDDEHNIRSLIADMLVQLGYDVMHAEDGLSGVATFREHRDTVSLVILDMVMPKMGGREVFEALRTVEPGVKVLLCSGYSQNGFAGIEELIKNGAKGFVQKPFTRQHIAMAIKRVLAS